MLKMMNEKINRILDIPVEITAVIGSTRMTLKELFSLSKGSIIELSTLENQEVELYVSSKKFAHGQVVTIDQNFGVRITSILNEEDLMNALM